MQSVLSRSPLEVQMRPSALIAAASAIGCSLLLAAGNAAAGPVWDELKPQVFGQRAILAGDGIIALEAPYRPDNVMAVPLVADVTLPKGENIKAVSFIVDENPSPVAAVFTLHGDRNRASLTTNIRLNQQSDVRVVVETAAGTLYMAERLVKFAGGQASCSAPPQGDPAEIAANMGKMDLALTGKRATASKETQSARLELNHPNHTGMVLDQITLHYIPLLMVNRMEVRQGDDVVLEVAGSITLSQNPTIGFDYVTNGAADMEVRATDTGGGSWARRFPVGPGS